MSKKKTQKQDTPVLSLHPTASAPSKLSTKNPTFPTKGFSWSQIGGICFGLLVLNLIVFGPILGHQFIDYDDNLYVYKNTMVQTGLNQASLKWAFKTYEMGHWHPLTWITYLLDYDFYKLDPGGFHLTNLILHILNSMLVFLVLLYGTANLWRSAVVGALFAIHPLHVEPVAWVASRKDVLSTFFGLGAIWMYFNFVKFPSWWRYGVTFVLLMLGMMSKSMLVTFPLVLLLLDFWPLNRFQDISLSNIKAVAERVFKLALEKAPLFGLSIWISVMEILATESGVTTPIANVTEQVFGGWIVPRSVLTLALNAYGCYLQKTFLPKGLAPYYPYAPQISVIWVVGTALSILILTAFVLWKTGDFPYLFVGWFWFLGTLILVIRFPVADRYTYVPHIGIFLILVWGIADWTSPWNPRILQVGAGISLVVLAVVARNQVSYWQDSYTLFTHTLAVTKHNLIMENNLGNSLLEEKKLDEAYLHLSESIRLNPNYDQSQNNMGRVFYQWGRFEEAKEHFYKSIQVNPKFAEGYYNLANTLVQSDLHKNSKEHFEEAFRYYYEALRINPNLVEARNNLASIQYLDGRYEEAGRNYAEVLRVKPEYSDAQNNFGQVLFKQGSIDEAIPHFQEAIRLNPAYVEAHFNLGKAFYQKGKLEEAKVHFVEALRLNPNFAEAKQMLMQMQETPKS